MINDLGNYRACQKIDDAGYVVASINISHSPISLNQGACFPKECTMVEYSHFTNEISNAITGVLRSVMKSLNITGDKPGILQPWTQISFRLRKVDEIKDNWKDSNAAGLIAFFVLSGPLLILFSLMPCIYHIYLKIKHGNS